MLGKPYGTGDLNATPFAMSAETWREDIEAYLVEHELSAELASTVIKMIDTSGWTLVRAVKMLTSETPA